MPDKLKIVYRDAASLTPYERNARTHSAEQIAQIGRSIQEFGWANPIRVDEAGGIIAGHGRLAAALEIGIDKVPTICVAGLTEAQRRALVIADNKLALNAGWDEDILRSELEELTAAGIDTSLIGFSNAEIDELSAPPELQPLTDPDAMPAPSEMAPTTRTGDIWLLGRHRLMCGSCTDAAAVFLLFNGAHADICITDPPYGLGEKKASGKNEYEEYVDSRDNLVELAKQWLPIARERADVVVFSPGVTNQWLYPEPAWVLCWFYGGGQLRSSWGFNCWQPFLFYGPEAWGVSAWEPILAYGKDPSLAAGCGGRPDAVNLNVAANAGDIDHPCPKPVALLEWLIDRLVFKPKAKIYEPFSGSGTTIVAASMKGHDVLAMEMTPKYVDIAVKRWQELTGEHATLEGDGRTFEEMRGVRAPELEPA